MRNPPDDPKDTVASSFISRVREEQMIMERVELLEQAPLFSVLHPGDLQVLASRFHPVRYARGEVIFREGEPAERLFLMKSGRVKLSIASPSGQEMLIGVLGRGQIFGELEVIDRGTRAMDARAMEDADLYAFAGDVFWTMLENRPALARRLLELMARRLRRADQNSQDLVFFDAPTRLARRLLQLAEEHGEAVGEGEESVKITVRVTQEEIAQMIGVTRESANRLVASFAGRGWISWNDGYPILLEPEALVRRAR
jgi:CRP/FNR family cyclic AMP-dependent transcriptional regulator